MNVELSSKEYRTLLDILHLADVVMTGHRTEEDPRTLTHSTLIQKLYALAKGEGLSGLIKYNESSGRHSPAPDFEESTPVHALLDEFVDHIFWDQLISRLTARDAAQAAGGIEHYQALSDGDRQRMETLIRQRYLQEFSIRGVANLELVERFDGVGNGQTVPTSD